MRSKTNMKIVLGKTKKWIGPILGVLCLFLVVKKLGVAWQDFRQVSLAASLLSAFIISWSYFFRAVRWGFIVRSVVPVRFSSLVIATMVGFFANAVLPARMGEFVRAYVLAKREDIAFTRSLATVVMARVFDIMVLVLMIIAMLFVVRIEDPIQIGPLNIDQSWLNGIAISAVVFFLALLSFLVLLYRAPDRSQRILNKLLAPISERLAKKVSDLLLSFVEGLKILGNWKSILWTSLATLLVWGFVIASVFPLVQGYPFNVEMPVGTALIVEVILCVGLSVPNAPGFVGTFEVFTVAGLMIANSAVAGDQATAFSLLLHAVQFLPVILMGFICMLTLDFSIMKFKKSSVEEVAEKERVQNNHGTKS